LKGFKHSGLIPISIINWSHSFKLQQNPQYLARNTASFILNANFDDWNVNLNTSYPFNDEITGTVGITNLFDKAYYSTNSTAQTFYDGVINRGRQLSVNLQWQIVRCIKLNDLRIGLNPTGHLRYSIIANR
jgi:outer membrane receptor protein involved in Fe transport